MLDALTVTTDSAAPDALKATLDPAARDAPMVALDSAVLGAHAIETAQCNSQNSDAALDPAHADTRDLSLKLKHDSAALGAYASSSTQRRPTRMWPTRLCAATSLYYFSYRFHFFVCHSSFFVENYNERWLY